MGFEPTTFGWDIVHYDMTLPMAVGQLTAEADSHIQANELWFYPYTDLCEHCLLSTFQSSVEKNSKAFYSSGIRTHDLWIGLLIILTSNGYGCGDGSP